jgi:putative MATE family efflux protein
MRQATSPATGGAGNAAPQRGRLTTAPLGGLIRGIAVPAGVGLLFQTLFNIVDSFWAGFVSTAALTALGASFPVFFMIIVLSVGIGAAAQALIAIRLGGDDEEGARRLLGQALCLTLVAGGLIALYGLFAATALLRFLGTSGDSLEAGRAYLLPILLFGVVFLLNQGLNGWLTAQGDSKSFRNALAAGSILNVGLDPLFMFGVPALGVPGMGVAGIAIATVLIQFMQLAYLLHRARRSPLGLHLAGRDLLPDPPILRDLLRQAVPVTISIGATGFGLFCITYFMGRHGEAAIAAYGIGLRIEQLAMLPMIGLHTAALSIIGQNHGAGLSERVREAARLILVYGLGVMTLGVVLVWPLRFALMRVFSDDPAVVELGAAYLAVAVLNFNAYALLLLGGAILQGMRRPNIAMAVALFRHVFGPLVVLYLLDPVLGFGLPGIYWGIVGIAWIGAAVTLVYLRGALQTAGPAAA